MILVSNDDGHSTIKTTYMSGSDLVESSISSNVTMGDPELKDESGDDGDEHYKIDGVGYNVIDKMAGNSAGINILSTQTPDYLYSNHNLVLNHHALYRAGLENEDITLITSMPFNRYYKSSSQNKELILRKKENLMRSNIDPLRNKIVEHYVMAEGVSGYFDLLYNLDGSVNNHIKELNEEMLVVIIDCGGSTTDISTFNGGKIDFSRSGSCAIGSLKLKEKVKTGLIRAGNNGDMAFNVLENVLRTGRTKTKDFTDLTNKCKHECALEINNFISSKVGSVSDIGLVYVIGGTSILLQQQFKEFYSEDILKFATNPIYATSTGMLKYLSKVKNHG